MFFFEYLAVGLLFMLLPALASRRWRPKMRRLARATLPARASTLASAQPGDRIAVFGRVASPGCVLRTFEIYRKRKLVEREVRGDAFVIEDETGSASIDPANADVRLWSPEHHDLRGQSDTTCVGGLSHGQLVLVIGFVQVLETVDGGAYRSAPNAPRIAIVGTADQPLIISDRVDDHMAVPRA